MTEASEDNSHARKDNGRGQERQWTRPGKTMDNGRGQESQMTEARKDSGRGQERQWPRPGKTMAEARNENVVRQERQFRRSK